MRNIFFVIIFLVIPVSTFCNNSDTLFHFDKQLIYSKFRSLDSLENYIYSNSNTTGFNFKDNSEIGDDLVYSNPIIISSIYAPWNLSSFWFTFILASVGTYTIYAAGLGPIAFGIVYFSSNGDKVESKKAVIGCLTGTALGVAVKLLVLNWDKIW